MSLFTNGQTALLKVTGHSPTLSSLALEDPQEMARRSPNYWVGRRVSDFQCRGGRGGVGMAGCLFPWVPVTPLPSVRSLQGLVCVAGSMALGWMASVCGPTRVTSPLIRSEGREAPLSRGLRPPAPPPWRSESFLSKRRTQSGIGAHPSSPTWETPSWDKSPRASDFHLGVGVCQLKGLVFLLLLQQTPCINPVQACRELVIPRNRFTCRPMKQLRFCGVLEGFTITQLN